MEEFEEDNGVDAVKCQVMHNNHAVNTWLICSGPERSC